MAGTYVIFCSLRVYTYSEDVRRCWNQNIRPWSRTARTQGLYLTGADGDSNMTWSGVRTYEVDSVSYCISSTELLTRILLCVTMGDVQEQKNRPVSQNSADV